MTFLYYAEQIEYFRDHLIEKLNVLKDKEKYKYILFQLEEVIINCKNRKYFNLFEVVKLVDEREIDVYDMDLLSEEIGSQFMLMVEKYLKQYCFLETKDAVNKFLLRICRHIDLLEEFVNFILNNYNFNGPLIEVKGMNVKELSDKYVEMNIMNAYNYMMDLREKK